MRNVWWTLNENEQNGITMYVAVVMTVIAGA